MSAAKFTPGPWKVHVSERPQLRRFCVVRPVEDGTWSSPHWEQLRDQDGALATFETEDEALAAIARATGSTS